MKSKNNLGIALVKECCPACLKEMDGPIVMNARLTEPMAENVRSMHGKVVGMADHFCEECDSYSLLGVIIVTVDPDKTEDMSNPWRTGGFFVVRDEYIKRLMHDDEKMMNATLSKRLCYMPHEIAEAIGLFKAVKDENN